MQFSPSSKKLNNFCESCDVLLPESAKKGRKTGPQQVRPQRNYLSAFSGGQILAYHQGHLKDDGMVKLAQIQTGQLLDLLKTVHQRIAVDKQLAGGLGDVQIVLKELVDGKQGFLIQRVNGILLEHFAQVDLAKGSGQLINQTVKLKN